MKRFLSFMLAFIMAFSMVSVASAEEWDIPEKVEISFKVGDSTLMINGTAVTVETPYVVGAGTTLVPLRVITEAFGARVTWVNETKEIILEYPDVNITLRIGNINATVNTHTETLPEAPVLSENGVTMVPLRFISETFGATVGYDNETAAITVVKETFVNKEIISSSNDLLRIGDSYWGWSMMNPSGMQMVERYFDGCCTAFEDEVSYMTVDIYDTSDYEGSYHDDNFNAYKSMLSGYTFSKAEKGTDADGNNNFRITARNKELYFDAYAVCKDGYSYEVVYSTEVGDSDAIATLKTILESFKLSFAADEAEKLATYDLSNVGEDGLRTIENEELKISLKVPATCRDTAPEELNRIEIKGGKSDDCTAISIGVYSKSETVTSKLLAETDRAHNAKYYNSALCSVSNVCEYETHKIGDNAYYYWVTADGLYSGDYVMYDVFFEKGAYVYNVMVKTPEGENALFAQTISNLLVEELDEAEVGTFIRADRDVTPQSVSTNQWAMELTSDWAEVTTPTVAMGAYANIYTGATITISCIDGGELKQKDMPDLVEEYNNSLRQEGYMLSESAKKESLGTIEYYTFQRYAEDEELKLKAYVTVYMVLMGGNVYIATLSETEEYANSGALEEFKTIMGTFKAK